MRGWGYLTGKGHGALGLDSEAAAREQDALALFIIDACKDARRLLPLALRCAREAAGVGGNSHAAQQ